MANLVRKTYEVIAHEDELLALDVVFCQINRLVLTGSSREIILRVDGDGSARVKIMSGDEEVVFSDDMLACIRETEAKETLSIGAKGLGVVAEIEKDGTMKAWIGE